MSYGSGNGNLRVVEGMVSVNNCHVEFNAWVRYLSKLNSVWEG